MIDQTEPNEAMENQLLPITDEIRLGHILSAIENFEITDSEGWNKLDELSSHTEFDSLQANPDAIFRSIDGHRFQVLGSVYVTLNYGGKKDALSMADSYPFHAFGHFEESKALIERLLVDTSSFHT